MLKERNGAIRPDSLLYEWSSYIGINRAAIFIPAENLEPIMSNFILVNLLALGVSQ